MNTHSVVGYGTISDLNPAHSGHDPGMDNANRGHGGGDGGGGGRGDLDGRSRGGGGGPPSRALFADHSLTFDDGVGSTYRTNVVHVMDATTCAVCRGPFFPGHVISLGEPYHALIHPNCIAYFDASIQWHHSAPFIFYARSNSQLNTTNPHATRSIS